MNTWETQPKALGVLLPEIVLWHWDASPGLPSPPRPPHPPPVTAPGALRRRGLWVVSAVFKGIS